MEEAFPVGLYPYDEPGLAARVAEKRGLPLVREIWYAGMIHSPLSIPGCPPRM